MKRKLKSVVAVLVVLTMLVLMIRAAWGYTSESWSCRVNWKESGIDYKYKVGAGCMIKIGSGWIPEKNYRIDRTP